MLRTITYKALLVVAAAVLAASPAIAQQQINLTSQVRGLLPVPNGGIGIGTLTGLALGNGASAFSAYGGTSCTNQFVRSLSAAGVATCNTVANTDLANTSVTYNGKTVALGASATLDLASADFANQGTTTTLLHGNAAGNPSFAQASLTADVTGTLPVGNGGTNAASASGTALDNITGFASTGFLTRTGAGTYAFQSTTNGLTLGNVAQIATNTVLGNSTSGTANVTALAVGGCSSSSSALIWTTNTGFGCNTSINAATLGGATFSAPGAIGAGTPDAISATSVAVAGTGQVANTSMSTDNTTGSFGQLAAFSETTRNFSFLSHASARTTTRYGITIGGYNEILSQSGSPNGLLIGTGTTNVPIVFGTNSIEVLRIASAAVNVTGALGVSSSVTMPGLATSSAATTGTMCWTTGTGNVNVDTTTTCLLSASKYKQAKKPLDAGLRQVMALRPVSYILKKEFNPTGLGEQIGFFAEDVARIEPRLVSIDGDGSPHAVRYQQLTAVLTKAIQEQQRQIRALSSRLKMLEARDNTKTSYHRR